jgi:hypothetical protein
MSWQAIIVATVVVAIVLHNALATAKVFRSDFLASHQRALQLLLIWLVPIVGATICFAAARADADKPSRDLTRDPNFHPVNAQWDDEIPVRQSAVDGD